MIGKKLRSQMDSQDLIDEQQNLDEEDFGWSDMGFHPSNGMDFGQMMNGSNLVSADIYPVFIDGTNFTGMKCSSTPMAALRRMALEEFQFDVANIINSLESALQQGFINNATDVGSEFFSHTNNHTVINCSRGLQLDKTLSYISMVLTAVCFVMILVGNSIILAITHLDKSLRSRIFVILQSLSVVSILYSVDFVAQQFFGCQILDFVEILVGNESVPCLVSRFHIFYSRLCENIILCHLVFLAGLRIAMTTLPFQARLITRKQTRTFVVCMYILCLIIEILFAVFAIYPCGTTEREDFDSPMVLYRLAFIGLVTILFVTSMLVSVVRARKSAADLQSTSQRRQSKLASIVITMFTVFYAPLVGIQIFLYNSCPSDTMAFVVIEWLPSKIQFALYALNPIILCLRQRSMRTMIVKWLRCNTKRNNGKGPPTQLQPLPK